MPGTQDVYKRCKEQLDAVGGYQEFQHMPVLDYEAAAVVREQFGLTGKETKNLFLRTKSGAYCMLVTLQGERADFARIKEVLGEKASIASDSELTEETGCQPMCAVPFGLPDHVVLLIDRAILRHPKIIFSPGPPERTVEMNQEAVAAVLENVPNRVEYL